MLAKRREFWGTAIGLDRQGKIRRIAMFKTADGYDFVDEDLDSRHAKADRLLTQDHVRREVEAVFGLREVKLEMPHLGIYASSRAGAPPAKQPASAAKAGAPKAGSGTWGRLLRGRRSAR